MLTELTWLKNWSSLFGIKCLKVELDYGSSFFNDRLCVPVLLLVRKGDIRVVNLQVIVLIPTAFGIEDVDLLDPRLAIFGDQNRKVFVIESVILNQLLERYPPMR